MLVPLHNHSEYSAVPAGGMDGYATVDEIGDRCLELGYNACALSDHGVVAGHLAFDKAMRSRDIKPIFAMEAYHGIEAHPKKRDQAHLLVGAYNDEGLKNLWRLSDDASSNAYYVDRVTWDMLEHRKEGLWATSACIASLVCQSVMEGDLTALNRYLGIFRDNFFIGLSTYPGLEDLNNTLVDVGQEKGLRFLVEHDSHFADPNDYPVHDAYLAMQTKQTIYTPIEERKMWHPNSLYIQSEEETREHLSYLPAGVVDEAIANTVELAENIDAHLPDSSERHLPAFIPGESKVARDKLGDDLPENSDELIWLLAETGLYERYGPEPTAEIWERFEYEMEVIYQFGLEHYLLQTWEFCKWADENDVTRGPGRGSGAGSLVNYCLYITDVDPMHYGLFFERFFNPGRTEGFPDIDTDFPARDRPKVRSFLMDRWGHDMVRPIGNVIRMKPKAALEKTWVACEITKPECDAVKAIINQVPDLEIHNTKAIGWSPETDPGKKIYVTESVGDLLDEYVESQPKNRQEKLRTWLDLAEFICSRIKTYGVHASGTVVSDIALPGYAPCRRAQDKETGEDLRVTQFPMDDIEKLHLCKQDLLVVRNLDTLDEWENLVAKKGVEVNWSGLDLQPQPEDMWELLHRRRVRGIFQLEQPKPAELCEEFRPQSVSDISIIVALDRPGPLRADTPEKFIARREGTMPIEYPDPFLEDILDETYGEWLYQEEIIAYFNKLKYDLSEADAVRKILGKKLPVALEELKLGKGSWKGRGYLEMAKPYVKDPEKIWKQIEGFASYSFNKSHSVSYGVLAFRTLYAKYHDPQAFIMACIRTNPKEAGLYIKEARRLGIKVLPPDILISQQQADVIDDAIVFGLCDVKTVASAGEYICELREQGYDVSSPETLDKALEIESKIWKEESKKLREEGKKIATLSPRTRCKSNQIQALVDAGAWANYVDDDVPMRVQQKLEQELLGVILTDDVEEIMAKHQGAIDELAENWEIFNEEPEITSDLPAIITDVRPTKTKAPPHKAMGILRLEYGDNEAEVVVWSNKWKGLKFMMKERTPGIFTLCKTLPTEDYQGGIHLERARKLT